MTVSAKKLRERHFAGLAATLLGRSWNLGPDRENPDFLVSDCAVYFGLEICEIFSGAENRKGSSTKRRESRTQQDIEALRLEYERAAGVPLHVRFLGDLGAENLTLVVPALIAQNLPVTEPGHQLRLEIAENLNAYVTTALRPDWYAVNDRVGWLDKCPMDRIAAMVARKAKALARYRSAAGADIRLLVVADRIHNSGKLRLTDHHPAALDLMGFAAVYFLSYPESVTAFG